MRRKFDFLGDMLERMGVPLMDAPTRELVDAFFSRLSESGPLSEPDSLPEAGPAEKEG